jgi:hypothetical protein
MTYPSGAVHYLDVLIAKAEYIDGAVNDVHEALVRRWLFAASPVVVAAV